jgi:hypothetical protein
MKIVDCFTFFDGLDVLEIRLNTLAPYVDRFVLCESPYTHSTKGIQKRLIFDENKERFKQFNITHLVIPDHLEHMYSYYEPYYYQVRYMINGLTNMSKDDIVLISDFDEIPDLTNYNGEEGVFLQKTYYFYLNCFTRRNKWTGTVARKRGHIRSMSRHRRNRGMEPTIGRGWHFSYIYPPEGVINKIEAFCHQDQNTDDIKSRVEECVSTLTDPFGDYKKPFIIRNPTGPQWLLDNRSKYEHLFYKGN